MFKKLAYYCGVIVALAGNLCASNDPGFDLTDGKGRVIWQSVPIPEARGGLSEFEWAVAQIAVKPTVYYYHRENGTLWKKILAESDLLSDD